jgi:CDGSH-type Zn-finger protein/uncharacterized Fe-S cluster protein YjdI
MESEIYTYTRTDDDGNKESVTVTWDQKRCIHAAACVRTEPDVFDPDRRPWIDPDQAEPDAVEAAVRKCPTGALHMARDGSDPEEAPSETRVRLFPNGPLLVEGDVELVGSSGDVLLRDTRMALCRCGRSGNQPLCDGSHDGEFKDAGHLDADMLSGDAPDGEHDGPVQIRVAKNGPLLVKGPITLEADDGETSAGSKGALCRCGASGSKPFCDGSHTMADVELSG